MNLRELPLRALFRRVSAGVDWGFSSPGAIVVVGETGNGDLVVLDESYEKERPILEPRAQGTSWVGEARALREKHGIGTFYADPARPDAIFDFSRSGLNCLGANNSIAEGIRRVAETLHLVDGKPKLRVLSRCTNLIRELRDYQYAVDRLGNQTEGPAAGQSDHAVDALRYVITELTQYAQTDANRSPLRRRPTAAVGVF